MLTEGEQRAVNGFLESKGLPSGMALTFDDVAVKEKYSAIRSRGDIRDFCTRLTPNLMINIPIVSANMECVTGLGMMLQMAREGGMGFLPQSAPIEERLAVLGSVKKFDNTIFDFLKKNPSALIDSEKRFITAGTVGVGERFDDKHLREVEVQIKKGIRVLLIDTARAYSINMKEAIERALVLTRKHFPIDIIAGNVSTPEGAKFLINCGADAIKVGQGPGAACRTREVGIGVPQLTAIATCSAIAITHGKTVIADGGIRNPGDLTKALLAGANAVMIGKLLAAADESEAPFMGRGNMKFKKYFGSASLEAQELGKKRGTITRTRRPEGVSMLIPCAGKVADVIDELLQGLSSAMSYVGVRTISHLREQTDIFVRQSRAGYIEGVK